MQIETHVSPAHHSPVKDAVVERVPTIEDESCRQAPQRRALHDTRTTFGDIGGGASAPCKTNLKGAICATSRRSATTDKRRRMVGMSARRGGKRRGVKDHREVHGFFTGLLFALVPAVSVAVDVSVSPTYLTSDLVCRAAFDQRTKRIDRVIELKRLSVRDKKNIL